MNPDDKGKVGRLKSAMYSRQVPPNFGAQKRRTLSPQESSLPRDWGTKKEDAGAPKSMVASAAIRYTRTALWWILGAAVIFFVVSMGIFGWYVFGGFGTGVRSENIEISVNGPLSIIGGEPTELEIVVTNRNKAALEYADLIITYPAGTRSVSDLTSDLPQQRISLGTIDAGGTRKGTIAAVLIGEGGGVGEITVEVEYQVKGTTAIFVAEKIYDFTYGASPVSISIESDTQVIPGQKVQMIATISANSNTVLRNVLLEMESPFGFTLTNASPAPKENLTWSLGDIRPGDSIKINMEGVLKGQSGDERTFRFAVGTPQEGSPGVIGVPIAQSIRVVRVVQPFIELAFDINGNASANPAVILPGDRVTAALSWRNELATPISNAQFEVTFDGFAIPQESIKTNDGFYSSSNNTIVWNGQTTAGNLNEIGPGESGTLRFEFIAPSELGLVGSRSPSVNIAVNASGNRTDANNVPENLQSSAVRVVRIASTPVASSQGFYHNNPYGVSGPVPPKVNQETAYAILWSIDNSTNPIDGATFSAQLPPYVKWLGGASPSDQDITFDERTNTVTWKVGFLAAGVGESGTQARQVAFQIGFTPSVSQVGQQPALLVNQVFSGTDAFTGTPVYQTLEDVTTHQPNDAGFTADQARVTQ